MKADLLLRATAASGTRARWFGQPFAWGKADCVVMAVDHLARLGLPLLLAAPGYSSLLGARKSLKAAGHGDLGEALAANGLTEIAPAAAIIGDLHLVDGEAGIGSLWVDMGNLAVLGWRVDFPGCCISRLEFPGRAFRTPA